MTSNDTAILAVAQKIYLVLNGVYNDVTGTEQTAFIEMSIDWINQWLQEVEMEADWNYLRTNDATIGTVTSANQTFSLPTGVQRLAADSQRDVKLTQSNGQVVTWRVVNANQLANPNKSSNPNRVAVVSGKITFSRSFATSEIGGVITADTIKAMPTLTHDDISVLSLIDPQQLMVLGAAKNTVLPDVVNNPLAPAYTTKYNDLLKMAMQKDGQSADLDDIYAEDLSYIRGVY